MIFRAALAALSLALAYFQVVGESWLMPAFSIGVTLAHTFDEIASDGGPIWDYLYESLSLPRWSKRWIMPGYVLFQLFNCSLAIAGQWMILGWPLLVVIRCTDFGFTHGVLYRRHRPNPGQATSLLLLVDVLVLGLFFLTSAWVWQ